MSIRADLQTRYEQFTPGARRIADVLTAEPSVALSHTVSELARLSGTSDATVIRFCRELGLGGYRDLRLALATEIGREAGRFGSAETHGSEVEPDEPFAGVVERVARMEAMAIQDTLAALDLDQAQRAIAALAAARRVLTFGVDASGLAAEDLRRKLFRVGVTAIGFADAHDAIAATPLLCSEDAVVAVSYSGRTDDVLDFALHARQFGATTIAITNDAHSPLHGAVDIPLLTSAREVVPRSGAVVSRIAQLSVVDCLFFGLLQTIHDEAVPALRRTHEVMRHKRR